MIRRKHKVPICSAQQVIRSAEEAENSGEL